MTDKNWESIISKVALWKYTHYKTKWELVASLKEEYILIKREDVDSVNAISKQGVKFDEF